MTVFIDYYMAEGKLQNIGVREESGLFHGFYRGQFDRVIAYMIGTEPIVVFKKSPTNITKELTGLEHYLEDQNIRARWTDLWALIKKESGIQSSLTAVAKGTLGVDVKTPKLEPNVDPTTRFDILPVMESRLAILQQIYNYAVQYDQLAFVKEQEIIFVELTINENP